MRSRPMQQHQHQQEFILPRLFDSLGLAGNTKLFCEAQPSRRGAGYNHLTIIARDGWVVAWGFNTFCDGPQASVHSEVTALRALFSRNNKAGRACGGGGRGFGRGGSYRQHRSRLEEGFDLVNVRFTFDSLRISRPCRRCWVFLGKHLWRFRRVMYTTSEGSVVCMTAAEFAADPPDHVSKGDRLDYYLGFDASKKKRTVCAGRSGRGGGGGGGGGVCSHDASCGC